MNLVRGLLNYFCDGGCKVGAGKGAASYLCVKDGKIQYIHSTPLIKKELTNNQAEYTAIILALADATADCIIYSDSEVVVKQLNGQYKVKEPELINMYEHAKHIIEVNEITVSFKNLPRENKYIMWCDKNNKQMMEMLL